ncbi:MFS transporter [Thermogemmatispora carboxidivorans]|uniref:MFS transporter n=1 Tax=Thermogemmatispora carboxidivorans TaxID=1382306 RepID=UPI00069C9CD6|nr:MFS transporter [Thermogemmatispora carboxidivorans]
MTAHNRYQRTSALQRLVKSALDGPGFRNRTLLAISFSVLGAYIGTAMINPVRVLYAQAHGASLPIIGAMASAYLVSDFLFGYPLGWLADRWGRKQVILIGMAAQALLSALYLPVSDPVLFIVLRFLEGMAAASLLPAARALLIDAVPVEQQGEAFGVFNAFFNASFLLGPALGGLMAALGYSWAFIGAIVIRLIGIVLVVLLIRDRPGTRARNAEQPALSSVFRELFTWPLLAAYLIAFGDYLYLGFDLTLTPIWMHDHLQASVALIGLTYTVWAVPNTIFSPLGGRVADRRRRSTMILLFGLVQVPLYFCYGMLSQALVALLLFAVHGIVYAFVQPAVDAHLAAFSGNHVRARIQGLYSTFGLIGAFVGSNLFIPLYLINFRFPWFMMGLCYGLCILVGGLIIRRQEASNLPQPQMLQEDQAEVTTVRSSSSHP